MWPLLYPPKGPFKYEKLIYRDINIKSLLTDLRSEQFTGYLEILAPHEKGLLLYDIGEIVNCFYEGTEELKLTRPQILEHFLETETQERDTIINAVELHPRVIESLGALEHRQPLYRELETQFLDMLKFFETLARKRFTGVMRFYRIRNNTRLGNLLLRMKKITTDQLKEAIRLQFSSNGVLRLGDALVQTGAIGGADLEDALDRQSYSRKGSNLEIAIALFSKGDFLGGYTANDGQVIKDQAIVMGWANMPEMLMDLIEGILPEPLNLKAVIQSMSRTETVTDQEVIERIERVESPLTQERRWINTDTLSLKADDLILDIHPDDEPLSKTDEDPRFSTVPPMEKSVFEPAAPFRPVKADQRFTPGVEDKAPPIWTDPAAFSSPPSPEATQPVESSLDGLADNSPHGPKEYPEIPDHLQGIDFIAALLEHAMGFLGLSLLRRQRAETETPGRPLSDAQLRVIVRGLMHPLSLVLGPTQAHALVERMTDKLEARAG